VVLGLALADGRLAGEDAFALSQLEESFQMEQWGEDWEAAQRRNRMREDLLVAEKFLRLAAA
jgi:chaperone required for assembly of F1-ATPase